MTAGARLQTVGQSSELGDFEAIARKIIYHPSRGRAKSMPINWGWTLLGDRVWLQRICYSGTDFGGRSGNFFAHSLLASREFVDAVDFDIPALFQCICDKQFESKTSTDGFLSHHQEVYRYYSKQRHRLAAVDPLVVSSENVQKTRRLKDNEFLSSVMPQLRDDAIFGCERIKALLAACLVVDADSRRVLVRLRSDRQADDLSILLIDFLFTILPHHLRRRLTYSSYVSSPQLLPTDGNDVFRNRQLLITTERSGIPGHLSGDRFWTIDGWQQAHVLPASKNRVAEHLVSLLCGPSEQLAQSWETLRNARELLASFNGHTQPIQVFSTGMRVAALQDRVARDEPYKKSRELRGACTCLEFLTRHSRPSREIVATLWPLNVWLTRQLEQFPEEEPGKLAQATARLLPKLAPRERELADVPCSRLLKQSLLRRDFASWKTLLETLSHTEFELLARQVLSPLPQVLLAMQGPLSARESKNLWRATCPFGRSPSSREFRFEVGLVIASALADRAIEPECESATYAVLQGLFETQLTAVQLDQLQPLLARVIGNSVSRSWGRPVEYLGELIQLTMSAESQSLPRQLSIIQHIVRDPEMGDELARVLRDSLTEEPDGHLRWLCAYAQSVTQADVRRSGVPVCFFDRHPGPPNREIQSYLKMLTPEARSAFVDQLVRRSVTGEVPGDTLLKWYHRAGYVGELLSDWKLFDQFTEALQRQIDDKNIGRLSILIDQDVREQLSRAISVALNHYVDQACTDVTAIVKMDPKGERPLEWQQICDTFSDVPSPRMYDVFPRIYQTVCAAEKLWHETPDAHLEAERHAVVAAWLMPLFEAYNRKNGQVELGRAFVFAADSVVNSLQIEGTARFNAAFGMLYDELFEKPPPLELILSFDAAKNKQRKGDAPLSFIRCA